MKLRHGALLALAGWWYLMLPPKVSRHPLRFSANAPLSQWYFAVLYSSANECEVDQKQYNERWLAAIAFTPAPGRSGVRAAKHRPPARNRSVTVQLTKEECHE